MPTVVDEASLYRRRFLYVNFYVTFSDAQDVSLEISKRREELMKRLIRYSVFVAVCACLIIAVTTTPRSSATLTAGADTLLLERAGMGAAGPCDLVTTIDISKPIIPTAILQGDGNVRQWFDGFSWQSFIALNWPAALEPVPGQPGTFRPKRDNNFPNGMPDTTKPISAPGPRVWEGLKADYELFQEGGQAPSAWTSYDTIDPPCGDSTSGQTAKVLPLLAKGGSAIPGSVNQAMGGPLIGQNGYPVRYEIRVNKTYYDYVSGTSPSNNKPLYLQANLPKYPAAPVDFPSTTLGGSYGVIEIKAAWREFTDQEWSNTDLKSRYYTTQAWVLDPGAPKCRLANLGLVGMHIAHKVAGFREWVWSTFEQIDTVPCTTDEQQNNPASCPNTIPGGYIFNNGTPNPATPRGYAPATSWKPFDPTKPFPVPAPASMINQVTRINAVPCLTQKVNQQVQAAAALQNTPWRFYKLINTQWPTNGSPSAFKVNDPGGRVDFYPAGSGTPTPVPSIDPGTTTPSDGVANVTMETYFQKKSPFFPFFGSSCMHCHYQAAQTDFSWVLADMAYPRNPAAGVPTKAQRKLARFPTALPTKVGPSKPKRAAPRPRRPRK